MLGVIALSILAGVPACGSARHDGDAIPVQVWVTTADQTKLLAPQHDVALRPSTNADPLTITVDETEQFQQMDGFGASFTDSSAWLFFHRMSAAQRAAVMAKLFDPSAGIGLSYLRQPIGSSEFALDGYTYDDVPVGQKDPGLARFSIEHDVSYVLPALRQAIALNPALKIMATPWSAPAWMKSSGSLVGGTLTAASFDVYARYLTMFLQAYLEQGVRIDALTLQNEPDFLPPGYPGMLLSAAQAGELTRHLGPMVASTGIGTKLVGFDGTWDGSAYATALLGDASAAKYLAGTAFHCYRGDPSAQSPVEAIAPSKGIYVSECSGGGWSDDFGTNLAWDVHTLVIEATRNWARAIVKWNIALDEKSGPTSGGCANCRGVVTVDSVTGRVTYNVEYYSLGHVSKFVMPGARRVASTTFGLGSVESVAFENPNKRKALVVLNTDERRTFTVRCHERAFTYTLPAGAVATFTW